MANKVTNEDKILMNELYLQYKTYAEVARQTGFSASTVKKYIIPNYISQDALEIKKFNKTIPDDFCCGFPANTQIWASLLELTDRESAEMNELRKEILI